MELTEQQKDEYYLKYNKAIYRAVNKAYKLYPFLLYEEIESNCMYALVKSMKRYNIDSSANFLTYLYTALNNEIKIMIRDYYTETNKRLYINSYKLDDKFIGLEQEGDEYNSDYISTDDKSYQYDDSYIFFKNQLTDIFLKWGYSDKKIKTIIGVLLDGDTVRDGNNVNNWRTINSAVLRLKRNKNFLSLFEKYDKTC